MALGRRSYERWDIYTFGTHLIETEDLDPVYVGLKAVRDLLQLRRWLVAYWCFYHAGFACWASEHEGDGFWEVLLAAAENAEPTPFGARWPRGHERRYFRGPRAIQAVAQLQERYDSPEAMVIYLAAAAPSYEGVAGRVREHFLFGPWISFKVADMLERCAGVPIDFSAAAVFMFKDPVQAAYMCWDALELGGTAALYPQEVVVDAVVEVLQAMFGRYFAPPQTRYGRLVGLQEIETILCKWKSHQRGFYPPFNDTVDIRTGLQPWVALSRTAEQFMARLPEVQ